jgi:hypothetical protein
MASFNYMILLGEFHRGDNEATSYYRFYQSMIKVPYLGSSIPIVLPSMILVFSLMFAVLSALKMKTRAIQAFRAVSQDDGQSAKKTEDTDAKSENNTIQESIARGEKAIIQEMQQERTKAERNKLLRFNIPAPS